MKIQGELIELKFQMLAFEMGGIVSKPYGDNARYDFILDINNNLYKVQLKSVSVLDTSANANRYRIATSYGGQTKKRYSKEDIDLLIAYVIPTNTWYIIPIEEIYAKTISLFPHRMENRGKYEIYKEAWNIL